MNEVPLVPTRHPSTSDTQATEASKGVRAVGGEETAHEDRHAEQAQDDSHRQHDDGRGQPDPCRHQHESDDNRGEPAEHAADEIGDWTNHTRA